MRSCPNRVGPRYLSIRLETRFILFPADAEKPAPQVRGLGYIVVEELIALVDQGTRKVEIARFKLEDL
jgi:hypothetical protein